MAVDEFDLRKEEYIALRKEIETRLTELGQLERHCVLAAAVTYAWLVTEGADTSLAKAGWFIPVMFALLGSLRSLSLGRHVFAIGRYVYRIEHAVFTDPTQPNGWEHFLAEPEQKRRWRTAITISFWVLFLLITLVAAVIFGP